MNFDPDNHIVKLCAEGITKEGSGDIAAAKMLYQQAWQQAGNDLEKYIAAHYLARNCTPDDQLKWNTVSLKHALKVKEPGIAGSLSSLYLNMGKSYEDIGDQVSAKEHYLSAASYTRYLKDDGYGRMIISGIEHALERMDINDAF